MNATSKIMKAFLGDFKPLPIMRKGNAIYAIKSQPFYGRPLFDNESETITFRRPKAYQQ